MKIDLITGRSIQVNGDFLEWYNGESLDPTAPIGWEEGDLEDIADHSLCIVMRAGFRLFERDSQGNTKTLFPFLNVQSTLEKIKDIKCSLQAFETTILKAFETPLSICFDEIEDGYEISENYSYAPIFKISVEYTQGEITVVQVKVIEMT